MRDWSEAVGAKTAYIEPVDNAAERSTSNALCSLKKRRQVRLEGRRLLGGVAECQG